MNSKIKLSIVTIVLFFNAQLFAQSKSEPSKVKSLEYSVSTMVKQGMFAPAISAVKYFSFGKNKPSKFRVGGGVRLNQISAGFCNKYISAPAKLTTGKSGPGVLFATQNPTNVDTFGLANSGVTALNFMIALNYHINSKINVEFNIDAVGFSFGGKQNVFLRDQKGNDAATVLATASPTSVNALLVSDNDLGSLNSELVGTYKINNHWKGKAGLGFMFTEYTLNASSYTNSSNVLVNNNRIRNKSLGLTIGAIYNF